MATLNDVAKAANVSIATVSRYLNNPSSVREKRAWRIREAIHTLNYKLDAAAQSLKTGKFHRIRVISPATGPFYWEIMSAIAYALSPAGYSLDITFTREPKYRRNDRIRLYTKRNVDGTIFFPLRTQDDDEFITYLEEQQERFVVIDRTPANAHIHQLVIDNRDIGAQAARLLLANGHRQFLFIKGSTDLDSSHDRWDGFCTVLGEQGITLEAERVVEGEYNPEVTYRALREHSGRLPPFTAVFASNDLSALACMRAFSEVRQWTVPRDYSLVSVDDSDYLPYCLPLLTSFRLPLQTIGSLAAGMLLNQIDGSFIAEKKLVLKAELKIRDSIRSLI